jgi:hypothetical protein
MEGKMDEKKKTVEPSGSESELKDGLEGLTRLKEELRITELLLEERQRVLDAIPRCELHGSCVPHALEWIEKAKIRMAD